MISSDGGEVLNLFFFTVSSTCWVLHNKTRHHYKWKEMFMKPPTLPFFFTDWQYSLSLCLFKVIASEWEESERSKTVQGKQTVRHFKSLKYLWYGCDRFSTNHFTEVPNGIFFFFYVNPNEISQCNTVTPPESKTVRRPHLNYILQWVASGQEARQQTGSPPLALGSVLKHSMFALCNLTLLYTHR